MSVKETEWYHADHHWWQAQRLSFFLQADCENTHLLGDAYNQRIRNFAKGLLLVAQALKKECERSNGDLIA